MRRQALAMMQVAGTLEAKRYRKLLVQDRSQEVWEGMAGWA